MATSDASLGAMVNFLSLGLRRYAVGFELVDARDAAAQELAVATDSRSNAPPPRLGRKSTAISMRRR